MNSSFFAAKRAIRSGIVAIALTAPMFASAATIPFAFNWGATSEGFTGTPVSLPVNELKFTAESALVFHGTPFAPGTTFTDYIALRIDQLFFGGDQSPTPYGVSSQMQ